MIELPGVGRIVVNALTIRVHSIGADDFLPFFRNEKVNESGCQFLPRRGTRRLAKGMIGIDQKRVPPK